jgi:PAS domain S-box-containing protein
LSGPTPEPQAHAFERLYRQQSALVRLATHPAIVEGDLQEAAAVISEAAAAALAVERVSVWLLDDEGRALRCSNLFEHAAGRHSTGPVLSADEYPDYLAAVAAGRVIDAHDARTDPRTCELSRAYLKPLDIHSMLNATIRLAGRAVGVVCHEQVGTRRRWGVDELSFAGGAADQMAHALANHQRRAKEQALCESEERFRELAELLPQIVLEVDARGMVCFANRQAHAMTSLTPEALTRGMSALELLAPEDRERARTNLAGTMRGETPRGSEYLALRADGTTFPVLARATPIVREERTVGVRAILFDISDLKRIQEELRVAKEASEAASRAKSQFLAGMSHEIRTPMNAILGLTGLLLDGEPTDEQRRYLRIIEQSGELLLRIMSDILDLRRIEAGELALEPVALCLPDLITTATELFTLQCTNRGLKLTVELDPRLPRYVRADGGRIRQVLTNLLANAVKFTEQGGIRVEVAPAGDPADSIVPVRFVVADTGIGVAPQARNRIFEMFTQADASTTRRHGGLGLGLSISKGLVERMGGKIGVADNPGAGAIFWFTVPLAVTADVIEPAPAAPLNLRGARILAVEDSVFNQRMVALMLERLGCRVDVAGNGREAVELVTTLPYDLILMDCEMPIMDGCEATREIRRLPGNRGRVPIITMSAHQGPEHERLFREAGMDDCLPKPISLAALQEKLRFWLPARRAA